LSLELEVSTTFKAFHCILTKGHCLPPIPVSHKIVQDVYTRTWAHLSKGSSHIAKVPPQLFWSFAVCTTDMRCVVEGILPLTFGDVCGQMKLWYQKDHIKVIAWRAQLIRHAFDAVPNVHSPLTNDVIREYYTLL
jgi:hypothetical protein